MFNVASRTEDNFGVSYLPPPNLLNFGVSSMLAAQCSPVPQMALHGLTLVAFTTDMGKSTTTMPLVHPYGGDVRAVPQPTAAAVPCAASLGCNKVAAPHRASCVAPSRGGGSSDTARESDDTPPAKLDFLEECTCQHNHWDTVRKKRGIITLRCRVCQEQIKGTSGRVGDRTCHRFTESRCNDIHCKKLHVHRQKLTLAERRKLFGDSVVVPSLLSQKEIKRRLEAAARVLVGTEDDESLE